MVVQHNLRAMNSNRMLGLTASVQSKSAEKLSSGYKINRAADDAAGLSISEKMRKQIRGLTQASLNAADGISAVQTAEGALNEVQDMLQRMNELAVKASNGTMSSDDRGYIQDEIDQLITEIDRVSETTKFNETYLLKGDKDAQKAKDFQYNSVSVIKQDLYYLEGNDIKTLKAGTFTDAVDSTKTYYKDSTGVKAGVLADSAKDSATYLSQETVLAAGGKGQLFTKGSDDQYYAVEVGEKVDLTNFSKYYLATGATGAPVESNVTQVTDAGQLTMSESTYLLQSNQTLYDSKTGAKLEAGDKVGSTADFAKFYKEITSVTLDTTDTVNYTNVTENATVQFVDKDGNEIAANGLYRYLDKDGKLNSNELYLVSGDGTRKEAAPADVTKMVNASNTQDVGALSLKLHVGADATGNNQISLDIQAMSAKALGIKGVKVDGRDDSNSLNAIETIKEALNKVSDQRSALGAVQNRLEHTIANLDNVVENTTAAESQIRDTDMATEMVKYSNNNILAQAGQAMLAQANQANQGVLSILG